MKSAKTAKCLSLNQVNYEKAAKQYPEVNSLFEEKQVKPALFLGPHYELR